MLDESKRLLEFVAKYGPCSLYGLARDLKIGSETEDESYERVIDQAYWLLALKLLSKKLQETEDGTEVFVEVTKAGKDYINIDRATR